MTKKIKILAAVLAGGFVLTAVLVIWAGIQVVGYASQHVRIPDTAAIAGWTVPGQACLDKAVSLMDLATWLEVPIGTNLESLRRSCLVTPPIKEVIDDPGFI